MSESGERSGVNENEFRVSVSLSVREDDNDKRGCVAPFVVKNNGIEGKRNSSHIGGTS